VFPPRLSGMSPEHFYCLSKIPLLRYEPTVRVGDNFHWTSLRPVATDGACLLHFKYTSAFVQQAHDECRRKEHWHGGVQYAEYAGVRAGDPGLTLCGPGEWVRFRGSRQLVELAMIGDWGRPAGGTGGGGTRPAGADQDGEPASPDGGPRQLLRQVRES